MKPSIVQASFELHGLGAVTIWNLTLHTQLEGEAWW